MPTKTKTKTPDDTTFVSLANAYARDVCARKIDVGAYARAACKRHLDDLERSKDAAYPYYFDNAAATQICRFASNMTHIKGKWATPDSSDKLPYIKLEAWQCFLLAVAFGWKRRKDKLRRFRELYWEISRKNSKSTLGAIIGLHMLCADNERGAEVYAGATSMAQAYEVFRPAWLMVRNNPEFKKHFGLELSGTERHPGNIYRLSTGSRFEALIGKPGDGASPSCAIIDEFHEHTSSDLYDAMKTGMGARLQPLRVIITTAGTTTSGPCYEKHLEAKKVLDGSLENDELFAAIFGIDLGNENEPGDDWTDFRVWKKANPNFGVSVFEDYLRGQLRDAMQSPSQQNIVLTKNLNQWTSSGTSWMNMLLWEKQKDPTLKLENFRSMPCYLGVDLASKIDIACVAFIFKMEWGCAFFAKHYLPEETIALPSNSHYRKWRDMGFLTETEGARTDLRRIEEDIKEASRLFAVQSLAFDPRESNYLISSIQTWASFPCVEVPQSPQHFNEPMKEMEAMVYAGTLKHSGDPLLTWQMGNVVRKQAHGGGSVKYCYPVKDAERNKIDAIVAGIMALGRAMTGPAEPQYQMIFI